jgi:hypothetical protein
VVGLAFNDAANAGFGLGFARFTDALTENAVRERENVEGKSIMIDPGLGC